MSLSQLLSICFLSFISVVSFVYLLDAFRPEVLLVGNVTVDIVEGNRTVGGAITNAAAVIEAQGKRACVVTTAGPEADLSIFTNHDLHIVSDKATLTFAHSYTWWGHKRVLHVTDRPTITLEQKHVPFLCRFAKTVMIMPLLPNDVESPPFIKWRAFQNKWLPQQIGLAAQGFQRDVAQDGKVFAFKSPHSMLLESIGEGVFVFLSDVESDPWSETDFEQVKSVSDRLLVTMGEKGCTEYVRNISKVHYDAIKVEKVVDTNGAGDTFAAAYMLALAAGSPKPALDASHAAARIVTKPQSCKPWCIASDPFLSHFITPKAEDAKKRFTYLNMHLPFPTVLKRSSET